MTPVKSRRRILREFSDLFSSKDRVLITIHADPDSMASAMAVKRLLWRKVNSVTIARSNTIKRIDNRTMARLLKIPLVRMDEVDGSNFSKTVLVDGQPHHNESFADFTYDVVIDHHPQTAPLKVPFSDIRPEYGATATILTEYLIAANIRPSKSLATALLYAIRVDTSNFESGVIEKDIKAFRYVFPLANMNILRKIEMSDIGTEDLEYFRQALENKKIIEEKIFSYLGSVPSPDVLVLVADFFMRCHEISWVIVSGIYKRALVVIIRNDGFRQDAGALASEAFGSFGSAGGRRAKARAEIPLSHLDEHLKSTKAQDLDRFVVRCCLST
jgi:nanoRNase/pAp phosphatase (c-di-AMP/oligoRNAs hydrolase)